MTDWYEQETKKGLKLINAIIIGTILGFTLLGIAMLI